MTLAELAGSDPVAEIGAALEDRTAWLVGGVVRDAVLGRALTDLDVAVDGDPERAARAVGHAWRGPVFPLSEAFGSWRAIDRRRGLTCDVSALRGGSIAADLALRDFTVNAIAMPLGGGEPIDPLGGLGDLQERRLRLAGPTAYEDDPLRALRMVRLATELGLVPDAETERRTQAVAPALDRPSGERVFAELRRIVASSGAVAGLELARRTGVLAVVLPELDALRGIEQSRFHHLDVYGHTLEVLARTIELEADPGAVFGASGGPLARLLGEPLADELTRGEALRLSAIFHDIAKPATRGEREDGRVTFIGHDSAGEAMVGQFCSRLRTSERLRAFVGKLTREHLALGFMVHDAPPDPRAVHGYLRRCEPVEVEVTVLSCADRMATRGEGQEPWIERHLELARRIIGPALEWREHGPPRPLVRGDELASELGVAPGPELGRLLAELEAAIYAGEVGDRAQALALARSLSEDPAR